MSIPLPRFANKDFVPSPVRSALVATQPYPSSPESHASTACVDLYAFASECSRSSDGHILVSPVGIDRVGVSSVDSGDNETDQYGYGIESVSVAEPSSIAGKHFQPSHYEAPAVPVNILALIESLRYLRCLPFSCHPTGCVRIIHTTL